MLVDQSTEKFAAKISQVTNSMLQFAVAEKSSIGKKLSKDVLFSGVLPQSDISVSAKTGPLVSVCHFVEDTKHAWTRTASGIEVSTPKGTRVR